MTSKKGKKILIITYYWPPSGGAGVQRWVKFVKYLYKEGWKPIIYTPQNPEYPSVDDSLFSDIPKEIEVLKTKIWEPFAIYKKMTNGDKNEKINAGFLSESEKKNKTLQKIAVWIRGNFFIPDARKFWIKPSVKYLVGYLKQNPVDYIVSTGPPHSMHLIGLGVKKKTKIPWVADFRDPWTNIDFYKDLKLSKLADKKHHKLEKKVLKNADLVITVGNTMKQEFEELGAQNVAVVTNGFDTADIPTVIPKKDSKYSIAHIGTLNPSRNPSSLWTALSKLLVEFPAIKEKLEIKLVGKVDISVKNEIKKVGLEPYLKLIPYLKHEDAIKEQIKSHVLLLLINNTPNAKGILTGKMFEYMSARTPILGIGPIDGDAAELLNKTEAGKVLGYDDVEGIKEYLKFLFTDKITPNETEILNYSRKKLTSRLIQIFDTIN